MPLIVKTAVEAARMEEQRQLEKDIEEAGILRMLSSVPPFYLTVVDDLDDLAAIAAQYRTKPRLVPACYEDVPEARETRIPTDDLVAFVHHTGYLFSWDEDTYVWCVSGVRDGFPDQSLDEHAVDRRAAVIDAIRYLVE
jgi:hypothetical protein